MTRLAAEQAGHHTRCGWLSPYRSRRRKAVRAELQGRKFIAPQHRVEINRSFSLETAAKDRLQAHDRDSQVRVQLLCIGLARRSRLNLALSLGCLLCGRILSLQTKRLLTIPRTMAVSALLASQVAPLCPGPEQGRYRCRQIHPTR